MVINIPQNIADLEITSCEEEKRTIELIKEIGESIHSSIEIETDCPSNHEDNKLPLLDLKVWLQEKDGKKYIMHEHYQKEVSSLALTHARSTKKNNSDTTSLKNAQKL